MNGYIRYGDENDERMVIEPCPLVKCARQLYTVEKPSLEIAPTRLATVFSPVTLNFDL